jgi:2-amino-4-hydroxy-6-hydroxymethyldihydropteridine diphosphokinase
MRAAIALGSNMGDREANLRAALRGIRRLSDPAEPFLVSHFYITSPVNCPPDSNDFINAAVEISPRLEAIDLMRALQAIEAAMGRPEIREMNSPRPIDLDMIYYGTLQIQTAELIIPHPRAAERRFVLAPLADIAPSFGIPGTAGTIQSQLAKLPPDPTFLRL